MVQGGSVGINSIHCGLVVQAPISDRPISVPTVPTSERIRSTSVEGSTCDAATIPNLSMVGNCVSTRSVTRCTRFTARGPNEMAASSLRVGGGKPASSNNEPSRAPRRTCAPAASIVRLSHTHT